MSNASETATSIHSELADAEATIWVFAGGDSPPETPTQETVFFAFVDTPATSEAVSEGLDPPNQTKLLGQLDEAAGTPDRPGVAHANDSENSRCTIEQFRTSVPVAYKRFGRKHYRLGPRVWKSVDGRGPVVKVFKIPDQAGLEKAKKILERVGPLWELSHANILGFQRNVNVGTMNPLRVPFAYDWGGEKNITEHIASNPDLLDVAKGLEYLHSKGIPHGRLKGTNIIINSQGHARLTNYGPQSSIEKIMLNDGPPAHNCMGNEWNTPWGMDRWSAPEMISPEEAGAQLVKESKEADIFAFAIVVIEVYGGDFPFPELRRIEYLVQMVSGLRPDIPESLREAGPTGGMWKLVEDCWKKRPVERLKVEEVMKRLQGIVDDDCPQVAQLHATRWHWWWPFW